MTDRVYGGGNMAYVEILEGSQRKTAETDNLKIAKRSVTESERCRSRRNPPSHIKINPEKKERRFYSPDSLNSSINTLTIILTLL